jgi:hypothetical protein
MSNVQSNRAGFEEKITTLVDHGREGRFIFAFCPVCDHAEEAEDTGSGRDQAVSASVAKIEAHLRRIHRKPVALKIIVNMPT